MKVALSFLTLCDSMDSGLQGSFVHGVLHARILEWVALPFPEDPPYPGIKPGSPALQAGSVPSEPPGTGPEVEEFREMARTGKPGELQSMGSQRVQSDLVPEQQQQEVEHTYTLWSSNSIPSPRVFCSCGPRINMRRG